jgi:hypothetical protein
MRISTYHRHLRPIILVAAAAALAVGWTATAADLKVKLTGAEETPPVTTSATGTASITVKPDKSISGVIKTSGIEGTAAHVHLGAPGQSGPPVVTLTKGADGTWTIPAGSTLTDDQYASYKAGDLYVNVHSDAHKPGEIRGQLKP